MSSAIFCESRKQSYIISLKISSFNQNMASPGNGMRCLSFAFCLTWLITNQLSTNQRIEKDVLQSQPWPILLKFLKTFFDIFYPEAYIIKPFTAVFRHIVIS
jgi:hypothetical protein